LCTCWEESEKRSPCWKGFHKGKRVILHLVCVVFASTTSAETCNELFPMHFWILGFAAITFLLPWLFKLNSLAEITSAEFWKIAKLRIIGNLDA